METGAGQAYLLNDVALRPIQYLNRNGECHFAFVFLRDWYGHNILHPKYAKHFADRAKQSTKELSLKLVY